MPLNGKYRLQCQSRWHQVDLHCKVSGKLTIEADVISQFAPGKVIKVGQSWSLSADVTKHIAKHLHQTKTLTPTDTEQWAKWTGSNASGATDEFGGQLSATLKEVTLAGKARIAVITLTGELSVASAGKLASRYGPNTWNIQWRYGINGKAHVNLNTRQVIKFNFAAKATETGKFYTPGSTIEEPYTGEMTLNLDQLEPPNNATIQRVATLIAKLGNENYNIREKATLDLQKLGLSIAPLIKQHHAKATDLEVKVRLERVLKAIGG